MYRTRQPVTPEVAAVLALVLSERIERGAGQITDDELGRAWVRYHSGHRAVVHGVVNESGGQE